MHNYVLISYAFYYNMSSRLRSYLYLQRTRGSLRLQKALLFVSSKPTIHIQNLLWDCYKIAMQFQAVCYEKRNPVA